MIKDSKNTSCEKEADEAIDKKKTKKESSKDSKSKKELLKAKEDIKTLEENVNALNDKYLRLMAEYDNFKKRTQREKETIMSDSIGDTALKLLPVIDNFERALLSFDDESKKGDLYKGLEMIYKETIDTFAKLGVTKIEAIGKEFDPLLHNAVMHIEDDSLGENIVCEEFQKGYMYKDKVIRYAMVKVCN